VGVDVQPLGAGERPAHCLAARLATAQDAGSGEQAAVGRQRALRAGQVAARIDHEQRLARRPSRHGLSGLGADLETDDGLTAPGDERLLAYREGRAGEEEASSLERQSNLFIHISVSDGGGQAGS
jgi:hypothetical protein